VRTAASVASALDLAAREPFNLLVSDLTLPDGNGYELMRSLKDRFQLRGIALSGHGMEEDIRRSKAAGFAEHLTKPVDVETLEAAIERAARADATLAPHAEP